MTNARVNVHPLTFSCIVISKSAIKYHLMYSSGGDIKFSLRHGKKNKPLVFDLSRCTCLRYISCLGEQGRLVLPGPHTLFNKTNKVFTSSLAPVKADTGEKNKLTWVPGLCEATTSLMSRSSEGVTPPTMKMKSRGLSLGCGRVTCGGDGTL